MMLIASLVVADGCGICMGVPEIFGWVQTMMNDFGIWPFVAAILILGVVSAVWGIIASRRGG